MDLWTMTGGVARYVELFMDCGAFSRAKMLNSVFGPVTTFVDEGKTILIEEFGRDYGTYFAILSGIASGKTTFAELKTSSAPISGATSRNSSATTPSSPRPSRYSNGRETRTATTG